MRSELAKKIQDVNPETFPELALEVFHYQALHNLIYAQFLELLHVDPSKVRRVADIPFLPIALFKQYLLQSDQWKPAQIFTSSGTTSSTTSRHALYSKDWYRNNARRGFERQYGPLNEYIVLALLPAYLERQGSSLVFMADDFIRQSGQPESGFYLNELATLAALLNKLRISSRKVLLLGVSFALLDLAEQYPQALGAHTIVMETGGMKGRRRELTREELHTNLQTAFGLDTIHSEYGMTELLSQAYAPAAGVFQPAPTLQAISREVSDPLSLRTDSRTGALNFIDLANLDTISFIATDDLGNVYPDGRFTVLGRMDASDTRGCNLLVG